MLIVFQSNQISGIDKHPFAVCAIDQASFQKIGKLPAVPDPPREGERCTYEVQVPDGYRVALDQPTTVSFFLV